MQYLFESFFEQQYQEVKEIFQKYTKTRYVVVESVIGIGIAMHQCDFHQKLGENLSIWGLVCLGTMIQFHDKCEEFEVKGISGTLEDCNDFCTEKCLLIKENFDYCKSFIF